MEFRQLTYFIGIAEARSFSKASQALRIAQPALSRQIALLEQELGTMLLIRNGRGALPTPAGEEFLARAIGIKRAIEEARWKMKAFSTKPSSVIRVGLPLSISKLVRPDFIDAARARFPNVQIRVSEVWTGHIHANLLDRKLDFGVISHSQLDGDLAHIQFASERVYLMKAPGQPPACRILNTRDLAEIPLVLPPPPHGIRLLVDDLFRRHAIKPRIVLESEVWAVITDVVRKGIACTLFPRFDVANELDTGKLLAVPIRNPVVHTGLCLARLRASTLPPYADSLFVFIASRLGSIMRHAGLASARQAEPTRKHAEEVFRPRPSESRSRRGR